MKRGRPGAGHRGGDLLGDDPRLPDTNNHDLAVTSGQQLNHLSNLALLKPIGGSPKEFEAKIRAEYDKWGPVIKAADIKAE